MKNRIFKYLICLVSIFLIISGIPTFAEETAVNQASALSNEITEYLKAESSAKDIQDLIDGHLTKEAGQSAEWYILALSQSKEYNFKNYETALLTYIANNKTHSATTRQKYALALIAIGSTDSYITATLADSVGKLGIASWVYGLHMLNNGCVSKEYTANAVIENILALRHSDGGWSITGDVGDIDVTAMAVQALAPHYNTDEKVKTAIDNALTLISERQNEDGSFSSYGNSNAESCAQVLIALSALGIDCTTDSRFIKNGNNLFDAVSLFKLSNGSFCHFKNGEYNSNATAQIFHAVSSYLRMKEGKGSVYIFDRQNTTNLQYETLPDSNTENKNTQDLKINYKSVISGIAIILAVIAVAILLVTKKFTLKNFVTIILAAGIVICAVHFINITSSSDYYASSKSGEVVGTVTVSVRCDAIADTANADHIPKDGAIIETEKVDISKNQTVFDVLEAVCKENRVLFETNRSAGTLYVSGISNIYEFDYGALSGWVYTVNGNRTSLACDEFILSDGDTVEWNYIVDTENITFNN